MPRPVAIKGFVLAKTCVDTEAVADWVAANGASPETVRQYKSMGTGTNRGQAARGSTTDPELVVALAGKRCYKSFEVGLNPNVTRIREDWASYLENILSSEHGSVLEHVSYTWAFEGVTRVFTGELNRHRAGVAISEGSMRYIRYDKIDYWMPDLFVDNNWIKPEVRRKARRIFHKAFKEMEENYAELQRLFSSTLEHGQMRRKKQLTSAFRRILGMGTSTGGVWTFNFRALRHVMTMRCQPQAEEEIALVFSHVAKHMVEHEPYLFGDFVNEGGYWRPKHVKV
jgi:thymidylate synthase (FAD)